METSNDQTPFANALAQMDHLAQVEEATSVELARIEQAYREIQRRDGAAQWHTDIWRRLALVLVAALLVCISVIVYQARQASQVQAFVQTVQLMDDGKVVMVGVPADLLKYEPQDSEYMDLLAQWVTKRRWKGDDDAMKRTRNDWGWLYRHSCGEGSKQLQLAEQKELPFKATKARASIEIKSITRTTTPQSFQVVWHEVSLDRQEAVLKEQDYIGTFTVSRLRPKTLTEALDNRLGLCVSGYDLAPKAGS